MEAKDSSPLLDAYVEESEGEASDDSRDLEVSVKSTTSNISRGALSGGLDSGDGTTNIATMIHLLKGNIGTGMLSLPTAIKHGGIIVGPCFMLIVALMAMHCMQLLVRCSHYFSRKKKIEAISYGQVAYDATKRVLKGKAYLARRTVNAFLIITQLGFCSIYFVFCASTAVEIAGWDDGYKRIIIFILAVPCIGISFIRNLGKLAYVSMLANVLCLFGLISIYQYCIRDLKNPSIYPYFNGWKELPIFMSMAIFSFEGIGVVLPLENEMKHPEDFKWVVNVGMSIVTFLFLSMGLLGYIAFGEHVAGSISLNLPDGDYFYDAVKVGYAVAMFFSYFIQFYVPMQILLPPLLNAYQKAGGSCFEYAFRAFIVLLTAACAAAIPQIENFISLIGAIGGSALALIFPTLFHMLTFKNNGLTKFDVVIDVLIMCVGLVGFFVGGYSSVVNIIMGFHTPHTDIHNSTIPNSTYHSLFRRHTLN